MLYPTELRVRIQLTLLFNIVRCGGYYTVFILYVKRFFYLFSIFFLVIDKINWKINGGEGGIRTLDTRN